MFNLEVLQLGFGMLLYVFLVIMSIRAIRDDFNLGKKYTWLLWVASFIIITISPFIVPIKINNYEDFKSLKFGIIYPFVEQHPMVNISEGKFPILATLINPWGHSLESNLKINLLNYIFSCVIVYIVLYLCVYLCKRAYIIINRKKNT